MKLTKENWHNAEDINYCIFKKGVLIYVGKKAGCCFYGPDGSYVFDFFPAADVKMPEERKEGNDPPFVHTLLKLRDEINELQRFRKESNMSISELLKDVDGLMKWVKDRSPSLEYDKGGQLLIKSPEKPETDARDFTKPSNPFFKEFEGIEI